MSAPTGFTPTSPRSTPSSSLSIQRLPARVARDVFRALLDALAQPGRPSRLPEQLSTDLPRAVVPALALVDIDVPVHALGPSSGEWADTVRTLTGAPVLSIDAADWVVALRPPSTSEIGAIRVGSAEAPERGARLSLACRRLGVDVDAAPADSTIVRVTGPGVPADLPAGRLVVIDGVPPSCLAALDRRNRDFPAGIDTWLCADDGTVVGLPRSSTLDVIDPRGGN